MSGCRRLVRSILIIIFTSLSFASSAQDASGNADSLTAQIFLSRVRLTIGADTYLWTRDGIATEEKSGNKILIKPSTIISFLGFAPGEKLSLPELSVRCREAELRLVDSGYVYEATVTVIPPKKNPEERTVLVMVTPGFFWRFSGGNAYAMIGKDGLFGERAEILGYAGWNQNGFRYRQVGLAGRPFLLGVSALLYGPGENPAVSTVTGLPITGTPLEASLTTGWYASPDVSFGVDGAVRADAFPISSTLLFSAQPWFSVRKYIVPKGEPPAWKESSYGLDLRAFIFPSTGAVKGECSAFIHYGILSGSTIAALCASGISDGATSFDLFQTENRSVRSGYGRSVLSPRSFLLASAEIRQQLFIASVPPGVTCVFQGFLFSDIAGVSVKGNPEVFFDDLSLLDAFGFGARILFENPVFANFTCSYGWNHDGAGRFIFACTAGF